MLSRLGKKTPVMQNNSIDCRGCYDVVAFM